MTRTIIIGDIHGCFDELRALLDLVGLTADDRIIALGDIVDRGPESEKVLEFFKDTPRVTSIMGNHERKHIRSARGEISAAWSQEIVRAQLDNRYENWLSYMETLPRDKELRDAILVHGMFEPGVPLKKQQDTVVMGTLTGEAHMRRHYAEPWYDSYDGRKPLVVGHHDYLGQGCEPLIIEGLVYGIDTGCVYGGRLTALILPEFRIVSVPSRGDHWAEQRRRYAVLAGSGRSDLDLDWKTLEAFAASHDRPGLSAEHQARAKSCETIARECNRLVTELLAVVRSRCAGISAELGQADDWASLSERKQAARFAQRVGGHPAASLLFVARRGKVNEETLRRRLKTPRELSQLAAKFGIAENVTE